MKNQKGFTLIELLAVIVISTTVLVPLLSGLVNNFEVNDRMHARKAASSVALATIDAFDKIPFENFDYFLGVDNENYRPFDEKIIELHHQSEDFDDCGNIDDEGEEYIPSDDGGVDSAENLCNMIFEQEWNNVQFDKEGTFRVFFYPYYLDEAEKDAILSYNEDDTRDHKIPEEVLDEVSDITPSDEPREEGVYRISVWIQYDTEYDQAIVTSGVITRE